MDPLNTCVLCQLQDKFIKNISSTDDDNIVIEQKVKFILPETDITSCYNKIVSYQPHLPKHICIDCLRDLNQVYKFKLKCMRNLRSLSKCIESKEKIHKISYNTETTDHQQYNYEAEKVAIKSEPQEIQGSNSSFEEIVVKEEHNDLNEEIDIKDDPFIPDDTYLEDTSQNGSTSNEDITEVIENTSLHNLLPEKSQKRYKLAYDQFMDWRKTVKFKPSFSENVLLAYFEELSTKVKPNSLWVQYSMVRRSLIVHHHVNISKYLKLRALLKRKADGYKPKKSKTLTTAEIQKFLLEAPDDKYLFTKVVLIVGIAGACRKHELAQLKITDIENLKSGVLIRIPDAKTRHPRTFTITGKFYNYFKKYANLRPTNIDEERFFLSYQKEKCTRQPVGVNKFGVVPKEIATYLRLENPKQYTGHCFRQSSVTALEV